MFKKPQYIGVIEQTQEEQRDNYAFREVVASANKVDWVEKKKPTGFNFILNTKTWRRFPVQNQSSSGSCVAQAMAKILGILAYLKWGVFIKFSAGHIYIRRNNKNIGDGQGMNATDVYKIAQDGVTMEELLPSQNLNEAQINALFESDLHKQVNLKIKNYIFLPVGDIETVASVIQTTKKGVMTWFRFHYKEWKNVPVVLAENPPNHHAMASCDFTLYNKSKALVNDESWGEDTALDGQRIMTEDFYKKRNTHASYPVDFKFETNSVSAPVKHKFSQTLIFIPLDLKTQEIASEFQTQHKNQLEDVQKLQDILKKEGLLPTSIDSTGLYYTITKKAVKAFQLKYQIASLEEINQVDGMSVGPKTIKKLNELYS